MKEEALARIQRLPTYGICDICGKKFLDHPMNLLYLDSNNEPYLNELCDGVLAKL